MSGAGKTTRGVHFVALAMFGVLGLGAPPATARPDAPVAVPVNATIVTRTDSAMRMTVPVTIGGKGPYQFVVDTGADRTVVSRQLSAELSLAAGASVTMHSMTGVAPQNTVVVPTLTIAGQTTNDINAPALDERWLGANGLLGIDTLKKRRIVMDFAKRRLSILASGEREEYDPDTIVVTAKSRFGQLVLVDADVDGTPITVIIDSGAESTIGNTALRNLLGKRQRNMSFYKTQLFDVTGAQMPAEVAAVGKIRIAGLTLQNAIISFADAHPFKRYGLVKKPAMLLGMDTLRAFRRVSVDFAQRKVRFLLPDEV